MSIKNELANSERVFRLDWLKWVAVAIIVGVGVVGNSYYSDISLLYRVLVLVILAMMALGVAVMTKVGHGFWVLLCEARTEIRRVVWPTRQETTQTTLVVVLVILIMGLILWLIDSVFGWIISRLIG